VTLPGAYYVAKHRALDRIRDVIDRHVRRICCVVPDEDAGGYRHWRCGRRRGHDGKHRFINYTWGGPGERVEYAPVEPTFENLRGELQRAPKRYGTPSRRQVRQKREKLAALAAERERSRTAASGGDA
jgi:hypothetical protein